MLYSSSTTRCQFKVRVSRHHQALVEQNLILWSRQLEIRCGRALLEVKVNFYCVRCERPLVTALIKAPCCLNQHGSGSTAVSSSEMTEPHLQYAQLHADCSVLKIIHLWLTIHHWCLPQVCKNTHSQVFAGHCSKASWFCSRLWTKSQIWCFAESRFWIINHIACCSSQRGKHWNAKSGRLNTCSHSREEIIRPLKTYAWARGSNGVKKF